MAYDSVRNDRSGGNAPWVHHMQPKGGWPANYSSSENNNWNSAMVTGTREAVPYPGYPSNYWYPPSHTAGPYSNAYPSRSEVNGQGAYNAQAHGYPPAPYPHYGDGGHPLPQNSPYPHQQPLHPRPQPESWTHTGGYGHGAQSQWQPDAQPPQNHYGNPLISPHPLPAWTGSGAGSSVPQYDTQDQQYPGYPPRNQPMGPKPPPVNPGPGQKKEFSAPPQIHKTGKRQQEPKPSQDENPPAAPGGPPLSENPSLARVQQVMARVFLLQEDVDEFVGHKTDKSYRCLEELLTKELLELDSVETNGQESVRQARKVAVQKIQGILDQLEKKAF
uniref:BCL2 associated athanogene 4 n=1 Tax=Scleropages formosus TaxID=113540 RepID=A0A8C9SUN8_SCLFO